MCAGVNLIINGHETRHFLLNMFTFNRVPSTVCSSAKSTKESIDPIASYCFYLFVLIFLSILFIVSSCGVCLQSFTTSQFNGFPVRVLLQTLCVSFLV